MVYHLIRRFASPTEIFVPSQINAVTGFDQAILTIENQHHHQVDAEILTSGDDSLLATKVLSGKSLKNFRQYLDARPAELLHAHYLTDARVFQPLTKSISCPKICSCYGYDVSSFPKKLGFISRYWIRSVFDEYDMFLAMSDVMKDDLISLGCPADKVVVHYHGIKTALFGSVVRSETQHTDSIRLLTIATLIPCKGHATVLKALSLLRMQHPDLNFTYVIVGDGPEKAKLVSLVNKLGLHNNVSFEGRVSHGERFLNFLRDADIFVHPSEIDSEGSKEGIPGTIVEAMSSGLPVIASLHGGIPSVIRHDDTGLLIGERDHVMLCEMVIYLTKHPEIRNRMGQNARTYAAIHLDVTRKGAELSQLYTSLIAKPCAEY